MWGGGGGGKHSSLSIILCMGVLSMAISSGVWGHEILSALRGHLMASKALCMPLPQLPITSNHTLQLFITIL